jgi:hypothetical protein
VKHWSQVRLVKQQFIDTLKQLLEMQSVIGTIVVCVVQQRPVWLVAKLMKTEGVVEESSL